MPKTLSLGGIEYDIPTAGDDPSWSQSLNLWREAINRSVDGLSMGTIFVGTGRQFEALKEAVTFAGENGGVRRIIVTSSGAPVEESIKINVMDLEIQFQPGVALFGDSASLTGSGVSENEKHKHGAILDVVSPGVTIIGGRIGFNSDPAERNEYQHSIIASYVDPTNENSRLNAGMNLLIQNTRYVGYGDDSGGAMDIGTGLSLTEVGTIYEGNERITS